MKIAIMLIAIFVAGCDTVTEYRCGAEQIEKANAQFEYCKTGNPDSTRRCWTDSTKAHCDVSAKYQRIGVDMSERDEAKQ